MPGHPVSRTAGGCALLLALLFGHGCSKSVPTEAPIDASPEAASASPAEQRTEPKPRIERETLEGSWMGVGSFLPGASLAVHLGLPVMTFKGNAIIIATHTVEGKRLVEKDRDQLGTFVIDPKKKPKTIDVTLSRGPAKGKTLLGIYAVKGNKLALNLAKPDEKRPETFQMSKATFIALLFENLDPVLKQKAVISGAEIPSGLFLPNQVRSARRVGDEDRDTVFLNLVSERTGALLPDRSDVRLVIAGEVHTLDRLSGFLAEQYREYRRRAGDKKDPPSVALRADRRWVPSNVIQTIIQESRKQGFGRLFLRAWPVDEGEHDLRLTDPTLFGPVEGELEIALTSVKTQTTVTPVTDRFSDGYLRTISVEEGEVSAFIPPPDPSKPWAGYMESLEKHLKGVRSRHPRETGIIVKTDRYLEYEALVRVVDACHAAGYKRVGVELQE